MGERSIGKRIFFLAGLSTLLLLGCALQKGKVKVEKPSKVKVVFSPEAYEHYVNGDLYRHSGDYRRAAEEFQKALKFDPDSYEIRLALAQSYYSFGEYPSARREGEKLTIKTLEREQLLADCARNANDWGEAKRRYLSVLSIDSSNTSAWWYVARVSEQMKDSATAVRAQKKLAYLSPSYSNFYQLVQMLWAAGRHADAAAEAERFLESDSSDLRAYLLLGESLERAGEHPRAAEVYRRLLEQDSTEREVALHLGDLYFELKEYASAESVLARIPTDTADFAPLFYLARIAYLQKNYPRAESLYQAVIQRADTLPQGFTGLALTYLSWERPEKTLAVARRGLGKFPASPDLRFWLGQAFSAQKEYDSARIAFDQLVAEEPENVNFLFAYAAVLERSGGIDTSVAVFKKVLSLEPEHAPALNYLGYTWADRNENLVEAKKMIEKALEAEPDNGAYLDSYGWVLFRLGKLKEAEKYVKKALEKNEKDAIIVEHLGDVYWAQGKKEEARAQYRKAAGMDPQNIALKEKLSR
ncbi:MAG: tetratricopeptide repeat protein [candidate division Zixibacteria bacterium]|nr:tetratricopeptide repeat protein [candidate division Zixibacteria bacterium]